MSLEQEIEFKQKELDKLRERSGDLPGVKKLESLWREFLDIWKNSPLGRPEPYDPVLLMIYELIILQPRYGACLPDDLYREVQEVIGKVRDRRGFKKLGERSKKAMLAHHGLGSTSV